MKIKTLAPMSLLPTQFNRLPWARTLKGDLVWLWESKDGQPFASGPFLVADPRSHLLMPIGKDDVPVGDAWFKIEALIALDTTPEILLVPNHHWREHFGLPMLEASTMLLAYLAVVIEYYGSHADLGDAMGGLVRPSTPTFHKFLVHHDKLLAEIENLIVYAKNGCNECCTTFTRLDQ